MPANFLGCVETIDGYAILCDQEMVDGVQFYIDEINRDAQPGDDWWYEMPLIDALQRLDADFGGTADAVRYRRSDKTLRVFDFKYGSGTYVEADDNKQMKTYGLGVLLALDKPVKEVYLTIVQPRFEGAIPVRTWVFPVAKITDFIADLQEGAVRTRAKDTPLVAGDHCKFCPAARDCPELEKRHHALVAAQFDALPSVAPEELANALASIPLVKERIKAIEEHAYAEANAGRFGPEHGWKLVDKRAIRRWKRDADVIEAFGDRLWAERELISPAQAEKRLGKDSKELIASLVESKSSGTVLVPAADDRPPAKRITVDDFAVIATTADKKEAIPVALF